MDWSTDWSMDPGPVCVLENPVAVRFKRKRRETAGLLRAESATEPSNRSSEM